MFYSFFRKLAIHIAIGAFSFFIAAELIRGVYIEGGTRTIILAGTVLGLMNFFVRPVLKIISLPLRLLTLGLFTFIINISMVWFVKAMFPEIMIEGIVALLYTTLVVWALEFVFYSIFS